jgi:hypothetical protein
MKSREREAYLPGSGNIEGSRNNGSGLGGSAYVLPFCLFFFCFLPLFFFPSVLCLQGFFFGFSLLSVCLWFRDSPAVTREWPFFTRSCLTIVRHERLCFCEKKQGQKACSPLYSFCSCVLLRSRCYFLSGSREAENVMEDWWASCFLPPLLMVSLRGLLCFFEKKQRNESFFYSSPGSVFLQGLFGYAASFPPSALSSSLAL